MLTNPAWLGRCCTALRHITAAQDVARNGFPHLSAKGADHDQSGQEAEAHEGQLDRDRLHDIRRHQHFEAEQQRSADAGLVAVIARRDVPPEDVSGRPDDPDDDDEHAEDLGADADEVNPVAGGGLEGGGVIGGGIHDSESSLRAQRGVATSVASVR
ncbi:hypothetical protein [Bradyrhizobium sp. BR 10289]|uniref:hypothetical protein n=1 Tax=Bradyrhizobium sp. BR 10289 TaxID=2749993 RepID=UPI001E37F7A6|nr:hypothetical protein [Bradyrhizobium sp. BR 10289]